jgi:uncharacterized membrane protein YdjX (TVP38/TMEM64 family)
MPRRMALIRLIALAAGVATAFAIAVLSLGRSANEVRQVVDGLGGVAPFAFVGLMVVLTVALFPFPVQAAAAGLLFGVAEGTVVAVVGGTLGAIAAFLIARCTGRAPVEALAGERLRQLLRAVGERGFAAVLLLRVVPGVPRDVANYLCGLTTVGLAPFALATLIGITPRAYAYVALGGSLGDLGNTQSVVAVALLVAIGLLGLWLLARERRRSA